MPRLKNDQVELFKATAEQKLDQVTIEQDDRIACTIVAVSGGYPGSYEKGLPISVWTSRSGADSLVFHAGTRDQKRRGGKRMGAGYCASPLMRRRYMKRWINSRDVLEKIYFEGIYYRRDIGYEFL